MREGRSGDRPRTRGSAPHSRESLPNLSFSAASLLRAASALVPTHGYFSRDMVSRHPARVRAPEVSTRHAKVRAPRSSEGGANGDGLQPRMVFLAELKLRAD